MDSALVTRAPQKSKLHGRKTPARPVPMTDLTPFFGRWVLTRQVTDHRTGQPSQFQGIASLIPTDTGLLYQETGRWRTGPLTGFEATRQDHWHRSGAQIDILFEDGRFFHSFTPAGPEEQHVIHDCPPDLYTGCYRFDLPQGWELCWQVKGPRKAYRMRTAYRPQ